LNLLHCLLRFLSALCFVALTGSGSAAEVPPKPFEPTVGQQGKDVVWVPTPLVLVEKMLDVAQVTPRDYVIDLGSGDGRNVIAAAKRGAQALGVEFNPAMVELSRRTAAKEGVADKAQFVQGDMYEADISQATVMALFLLPENLDKLVGKFLQLKPGTRIVSNQFSVTGWEPDETGRAEGDCGSWCTWLLHIVPAAVAGTWHLPQGELHLEQKFQMLTGTLTTGNTSTPISGRLHGEQINFTAGSTPYTGRVNADTMLGTDGVWRAVRVD